MPDLSAAPLTPKQQRKILKANYQRMKQEAEELAGLAKSMKDEPHPVKPERPFPADCGQGGQDQKKTGREDQNRGGALPFAEFRNC